MYRSTLAPDEITPGSPEVAKAEMRSSSNEPTDIGIKGRTRRFLSNARHQRLAIFGSALREDFGPESDIDVLVEFEPGRIPGLLGIAGMELELSGLFTGRKVDLRTPEDLSPYFRRDVLATAEVQYDQG